MVKSSKKGSPSKSPRRLRRQRRGQGSTSPPSPPDSSNSPSNESKEEPIQGDDDLMLNVHNLTTPDGRNIQRDDADATHSDSSTSSRIVQAAINSRAHIRRNMMASIRVISDKLPGSMNRRSSQKASPLVQLSYDKKNQVESQKKPTSDADLKANPKGNHKPDPKLAAGAPVDPDDDHSSSSDDSNDADNEKDNVKDISVPKDKPTDPLSSDQPTPLMKDPAGSRGMGNPDPSQANDEPSQGLIHTSEQSGSQRDSNNPIPQDPSQATPAGSNLNLNPTQGGVLRESVGQLYTPRLLRACSGYDLQQPILQVLTQLLRAIIPNSPRRLGRIQGILQSRPLLDHTGTWGSLLTHPRNPRTEQLFYERNKNRLIAHIERRQNLGRKARFGYFESQEDYDEACFDFFVLPLLMTGLRTFINNVHVGIIVVVEEHFDANNYVYHIPNLSDQVLGHMAGSVDREMRGRLNEHRKLMFEHILDRYSPLRPLSGPHSPQEPKEPIPSDQPKTNDEGQKTPTRVTRHPVPASQHDQGSSSDPSHSASDKVRGSDPPSTLHDPLPLEQREVLPSKAPKGAERMQPSMADAPPASKRPALSDEEVISRYESDITYAPWGYTNSGNRIPPPKDVIARVAAAQSAIYQQAGQSDQDRKPRIRFADEPSGSFNPMRAHKFTTLNRTYTEYSRPASDPSRGNASIPQADPREQSDSANMPRETEMDRLWRDAVIRQSEIDRQRSNVPRSSPELVFPKQPSRQQGIYSPLDPSSAQSPPIGYPRPSDYAASSPLRVEYDEDLDLFIYPNNHTDPDQPLPPLTYPSQYPLNPFTHHWGRWVMYDGQVIWAWYRFPLRESQLPVNTPDVSHRSHWDNRTSPLTHQEVVELRASGMILGSDTRVLPRDLPRYLAYAWPSAYVVEHQSTDSGPTSRVAPSMRDPSPASETHRQNTPAGHSSHGGFMSRSGYPRPDGPYSSGPIPVPSGPLPSSFGSDPSRSGPKRSNQSFYRFHNLTDYLSDSPSSLGEGNSPLMTGHSHPTDNRNSAQSVSSGGGLRDYIHDSQQTFGFPFDPTPPPGRGNGHPPGGHRPPVDPYRYFDPSGPPPPRRPPGSGSGDPHDDRGGGGSPPDDLTVASRIPRERGISVFKVKPDIKEYHDLTREHLFRKWHDHFMAVSLSQGMDLVLNPHIRPDMLSDRLRDQYFLMNRFLYRVLNEHIKTSQGRTLVRRFRHSLDGFGALQALREHAQSSASAHIVLQKIRTQLTSGRLTSAYRGSIVDWVNAWIDMSDTYNEQCADTEACIQPFLLKQLLMEAVSGVPSLARIQTEEHTRTMTGMDPLNWHTYQELLLQCATTLDEQRGSNSTRSGYSALLGDITAGDDPFSPSSPDDASSSLDDLVTLLVNKLDSRTSAPSYRIPDTEFKTLPPELRREWAKVSPEIKAVLARTKLEVNQTSLPSESDPVDDAASGTQDVDNSLPETTVGASADEIAEAIETLSANAAASAAKRKPRNPKLSSAHPADTRRALSPQNKAHNSFNTEWAANPTALSSGGNDGGSTTPHVPNPFEVFQATQSQDMRVVPPLNPGFSATSNDRSPSDSLYSLHGDGHQSYDVQALTHGEFCARDWGDDSSDSDADDNVYASDFHYGGW